MREEAHVFRRELKKSEEHEATVVYILNELCVDVQHYTDIELMKVQSDWRSATSAKHSTKSEAFRSEKLSTLTGKYKQAVVDLCDTQVRLRDEREEIQILLDHRYLSRRRQWQVPCCE